MDGALHQHMSIADTDWHAMPVSVQAVVHTLVGGVPDLQQQRATLEQIATLQQRVAALGARRAGHAGNSFKPPAA